MNSLNPEGSLDLLPDGNAGQDDEVRTQVWGLLTSLHSQHPFVERRREQRYPFPHLMHLTPLADDGVTPLPTSIVVVGKYLSQRGIGFYHPQPLPYRRLIASLEAGNGTWYGFLIDVTWCRFTRQHWYESGGRFLHAVSSPVNDSTPGS